MELIPLYQINNRVLVGLKEDHIQKTVNDSLVIEINLKTKKIHNGPWSGQKKLKFGYYIPIGENERKVFFKKITEVFSQNQIMEMEDLLLNPTKESIDSLIWVPKRLRNRKVNVAKEKRTDYKKIIENLISVRHKLFQEALNYAMKNELSFINEVFDVGDVYEFNLRHLDNAKDVNLQLLVDLIKDVQRTTESIANLNKIDLDEFGV